MKATDIFVGDKYFPYAVALEVTLACNMRCLHCGSFASGENRSNSLSFDEWCNVVDQLKSLGTEYVTLSGGEPFLYTKWRELVKHIGDLGMKPMIISNGSVITNEDIIFMKENKLLHLSLSLDGNEEIHDFIRQHKGSFRKVIDTVKRCQENGLQVTLVTSINKYNFYIREEILKIILENNIKLWQLQIVNSFGRAGEYKDTMLIDKKQYVQLIDDVKKWQEEYKGVIKIVPADSLGYCDDDINSILGETEWDGCNAGKFVLGIEANGNVKGCLSLQDDVFISGNVRKNSLSDIWNNDENFPYSRGYNHNDMENACGICVKAEQCKAGCLGVAYSIHKSIKHNSYCYRNITKLSVSNSL